MKLIINNIEVDLKENEKISFVFQANDIGDLSSRQTNYTNTFSLPKTAKNTKAFQKLGIVGNTSLSPYAKNEAYLYSNSGECLIYNGWAVVTETNDFFKINIYDGIIDLFKSIENKTLADLDLTDLQHEKTVAEVVSTQNLSKPYVYVLADYNGKSIHSSKINTDYLIPSVKASWLLEKIEAFAGVQINGTFKTNVDFTNLFLSYPKNTPPLVGASLLTSASLSPNEYSVSFTDSNFLIKFDATSFLNVAFFSVSTDKLKVKALQNFTFRADFVLNPNITIVRQNGSTYKPYATFNGNTFLCDGTTRTISASYLMLQNQEIDFNFNVQYNSPYDNPSSLSDFFTSCDFKQLTAPAFFEQDFAGLGLKDFLKEIIVRFNLTIFKDKYSNVYTFKYLNEILSSTHLDWSNKFHELNSEIYIYGSYAQKNFFKYNYNDKEATYNDYYINVSNENLKEATTAFQSSVFTKELNPSSDLGFTSNVYKFWNKEIKDNGSIDYKNLGNRYYFLRAIQKTGTFHLISEVYGNQQTITTSQADSYERLDFKAIIENYYSEMKRLLNFSKITPATFRLTEKDILNLDFSRPVYVKQLGGSFLLNKVNYTEGEFSKTELIKIN